MPSHIYVVGRDIAKTFVIAPVVVVLDEGLNSWVLGPVSWLQLARYYLFPGS